MAPSATETVTIQPEAPVLKLHSTRSGTGDYKALAPHDFDREAEEGKKEGFGAAKVRRIPLMSKSVYAVPNQYWPLKPNRVGVEGFLTNYLGTVRQDECVLSIMRPSSLSCFAENQI